MHVAVTPEPSTAVAVIFASPALTAVTNPFSSTVATSSLSLVHVKLRLSASSGATVAASCAVKLFSIVSSLSSSITEVTSFGVTVTLHVAVTPEPSTAVAVMFASPTLTAVTNPFSSTVATSSLSLVHIKPRSSALSGATVAASCAVKLFSIVSSFLLSVTEVTSFGETVTLQVAVTPEPSTAVAVMFASPTLTAVTNPFSSTVATSSLSLLHFRVLFLQFSGSTVAVSCNVDCLSNVASVLSKEISETGTENTSKYGSDEPSSIFQRFSMSQPNAS